MVRFISEVAKHGVRFATSRLAVRKDGPIVSIHYIKDGIFSKGLVNSRLGCILGECAVESEDELFWLEHNCLGVWECA